MTSVTLLDGGMGQELLARSGDKPTPLWSTQVMIDHPGLVADIHRDYFKAGATVATTNSYAILRDRLAAYGNEDQFHELLMAAMTEATSARLTHGSGLIAGSIGPIKASYRPDLHPSHAEAAPIYSEIATLLSPGVDLILCESVASLTHAASILDGAAAAGKPIWLSVTLDDNDGSKLRSGEDVKDLLPLAKGKAAALLANCSVPEAMEAAMAIFATGGLPFGAYANGFTHISEGFLGDAPTVDTLTARTDITPEVYADFALGWAGQGATIIGGCCEVGPAHIRAIHDRLTQAGYKIV